MVSDWDTKFLDVVKVKLRFSVSTYRTKLFVSADTTVFFGFDW